MLNLNLDAPSFASIIGTALALASAGDSIESPRFKPQSDTSLSITVVERTTESLEEGLFISTVDGEEVARDEWDSDTSDIEVTIRIVDEIEEVDDESRILQLVRSFDEVAGSATFTGSADGEAFTQDSDLTSPLVGRTVRFAWDGDVGEHEATFEGSEESDVSDFEGFVLSGLTVDAHGAWFLPPADVTSLEVGDTWELGPEPFFDMLNVGGDFWVGPSTEGNEPPEEICVARREARAVKRTPTGGSTECELVSVEEVDGVSVARIDIELEVSVDATSDTEGEVTLTLQGGEEVVTSKSVVSEIEDEIEATGVLLWDLDHHRPISIKLDREQKSRSRETESYRVNGESHEVFVERTMAVKGAIELRFE